jgi:N-acetylglutamate synthase-like GNAT family acetyltransferase
MNIKPNIEFATELDIEETQELLTDIGLGLSGDIEDHVVIREDGMVGAAGKLQQTDINRFHLEVLGVRDDHHGDGLGTLFLSTLTSAPWNYCQPLAMPVSGQYAVTCVAKGDAAHFYEKLGFKPYAFSMLAAKYYEQCDNCPDREECQPLPMIFESANI